MLHSILSRPTVRKFTILWFSFFLSRIHRQYIWTGNQDSGDIVHICDNLGKLLDEKTCSAYHSTYLAAFHNTVYCIVTVYSLHIRNDTQKGKKHFQHLIARIILFIISIVDVTVWLFVQMKDHNWCFPWLVRISLLIWYVNYAWNENELKFCVTISAYGCLHLSSKLNRKLKRYVLFFEFYRKQNKTVITTSQLIPPALRTDLKNCVAYPFQCQAKCKCV